MEFQRLTLDHLSHIRPYFQYAPANTCEYTVGCMFPWRTHYETEFAEWDGILFTRQRDPKEGTYYNLPLCNDLPLGIELLVQHEEVRSRFLRFCTIPEEALPFLTARFPRASVTEQPDYADYIYRTEDLTNLKGKKFHNQRNLIHQFLRNNPDWTFDIMTEENASSALEFLQKLKERDGVENEAKEGEFLRVTEVLEQFSQYRLFGGMLRAQGAVVGFSLGDRQKSTLFTHIEKADKQVRGAYQMLVNQFSIAFSDNVEYFNREDDMGDPGLRQAKEAYNPIMKLKKFKVEISLS